MGQESLEGRSGPRFGHIESEIPISHQSGKKELLKIFECEIDRSRASALQLARMTFWGHLACCPPHPRPPSGTQGAGAANSPPQPACSSGEWAQSLPPLSPTTHPNCELIKGRGQLHPLLFPPTGEQRPELNKKGA